MTSWVLTHVGKLSVLFDEPAAFSQRSPGYEVKKSYQLIGFNQIGSVWWKTFGKKTKLVVRDFLFGKPTRIVRPEIPGVSEIVWYMWHTHVEGPSKRRFAILGGYHDQSDGVKLLRIDLDDLQIFLGPEIFHYSDRRNFSPNMSFFSWTTPFLITYCRSFDIETMTSVGELIVCRGLEHIATENSGAVLLMTIDNHRKLWRFGSNILEDVPKDFACSSVPADQLSMLAMVSNEEAQKYDHRMRPILLASHFLTTRCLSVLARREPPHSIRESLPDEECKVLFDGFRSWFTERQSDKSNVVSQYVIVRRD